MTSMPSMEPLYEAIVEQDGRIRLRSPVPLETGAKVFVSIPRKERDSAVCGLELSERSLAEGTCSGVGTAHCQLQAG